MDFASSHVFVNLWHVSTIPRSSVFHRASHFPSLLSLQKAVCFFSTGLMATKTYTQIVAPPTNHFREKPWDLSVTFTHNQHTNPESSHYASSDFRRERTAPPSLGHSRSKTLPTRFSPYSRNSHPPVPKNIIYGVHTSLNLPPYKSPADEFLPQVKVCHVYLFKPVPSSPTLRIPQSLKARHHKQKLQRLRTCLHLRKLLGPRAMHIKFTSAPRSPKEKQC